MFARADVDRKRRGVQAVEAYARAVRRGREVLGSVAAIDFHGIIAVAAFVQVGVVAGVPDEAVVALLTEDLVVGVAAGRRVVIGPAKEEVEAALAQQRVIGRL